MLAPRMAIVSDKKRGYPKIGGYACTWEGNSEREKRGYLKIGRYAYTSDGHSERQKTRVFENRMICFHLGWPPWATKNEGTRQRSHSTICKPVTVLLRMKLILGALQAYFSMATHSQTKPWREPR